jgi:hypothetical protein
MLFGLTNTSVKFQVMMNAILGPFLRRFVLVFFNNILIFSSSRSEHLRHVHLVLSKLQEHNLFIKRSKCAFSTSSVAYRDHVISAQGITMDEQKIHAMLDWPHPCTVRAVHAFLRLAGYYRRFIKDFGTIAETPTKLLQKDGFWWSPEAAQAFAALQRALTQAPVLQLPAFDATFIVECDASGSSISVVLHQGTGPITFFSRPMAPRHTKLVSYEHELIGLVQAIRH